ncbi:hypothetical protein Daus18300_004323 [Diaporthe australafricana]|uniref:EamA domain-containing protein n=1 Tax=Diaporthe australafricana TaxID=127596 RepID=A0ABR3X9R7_9PEZI
MGNYAPNASFVARHKPSLLVLASQVSAACIHGIVKVLETGERPVHPFQILQVRLLITGVSCMLYLWCNGSPDFPLGSKDVRPLLIVRAVGGICGAIGFYFSIIYLTIAQATALNFLAPMGAMLMSRYFDYGSFSIADRVGAVVALTGVVLVVQPDTIFQSTEIPTSIISRSSHETPKQLKGVVCGLIGIAGGVEFLLTAGISSDTSSAATVMIYSQVLWALALDRIIWHVDLNVWSIIGVISVIGSLTLVSMVKEVTPSPGADGIRYETLSADANDSALNIDLESLCVSTEDGDTAVDNCQDSR